MRGYSLDDVMKGFLLRHFEDQAELVREFTQQVNRHDSRSINAFLAETLTVALKLEYGPVQIYKLGLMYGLCLGVIMQREKKNLSIAV